MEVLILLVAGFFFMFLPTIMLGEDIKDNENNQYFEYVEWCVVKGGSDASKRTQD
jgi:hypothetical protein